MAEDPMLKFPLLSLYFMDYWDTVILTEK